MNGSQNHRLEAAATAGGIQGGRFRFCGAGHARRKSKTRRRELAGIVGFQCLVSTSSIEVSAAISRADCVTKLLDAAINSIGVRTAPAQGQPNHGHDGISGDRRPGCQFLEVLMWIGSNSGPRSHCVQKPGALSD